MGGGLVRGGSSSIQILTRLISASASAAEKPIWVDRWLRSGHCEGHSVSFTYPSKPLCPADGTRSSLKERAPNQDRNVSLICSDLFPFQWTSGPKPFQQQSHWFFLFLLPICNSRHGSWVGTGTEETQADRMVQWQIFSISRCHCGIRTAGNHWPYSDPGVRFDILH